VLDISFLLASITPMTLGGDGPQVAVAKSDSRRYLPTIGAPTCRRSRLLLR
jgi:hypothetical protein